MKTIKSKKSLKSNNGDTQVSSTYNLACFRKKRIVKILSVLLLQTFFFYNIGFATIDKAPPSPEETPTTREISIDNIGVSKDIGSIKTRYKGKDGKLIIHIQDAHCNYEAQTNISKILENFSKTYNINLVSVEGADGFIDTSWFKAFPDAEIRKEVADYFMKKGEITGAEFLSITEDYPIKLYGAENRDLYIKNLNAFTSTYPQKEEIEKYLLGIKTILGKLKGYIYTRKLKDFDNTIEKYKDKDVTLSDYANILSVKLKRHNIDLKSYSDFAKLIYTLVYEDKIDFKVVDRERAELIDKLSKKLPKEKLQDLVVKSFSFKTGKVTAAEYYSYLKELTKENGINLTKTYPNLANYVIYTRLYEKIDNEKLFEELDTIKNAIKNKLFKNEDQRTLSKCWDNVNILLGLINIKLSNKEFDYYRAHKRNFDPTFFTNFIQSKIDMYNLSYSIEEPSRIIKENLPKLEKFYEIATKRDRTLVNNTMKFMDKEKVNAAVLITGGFHTEGIKHVLEEKDISYVVVCPNITKDVESPYIQVLTNQKTPFEELLIESATPKKDESLLAPYLIARAIMLDEKALEKLDKKIVGEEQKGLKGLSGRVKAVKEEWVKEYVGLFIERSKKAAYKLDFDILRNTFLLAFYDSVRELYEQDKLETPQDEFVEDIEEFIKKEFARLELQDKHVHVTAGKKSMAHYEELTDEQHKALNKILRQSFADGTYEKKIVEVKKGRTIDVILHYGLEDRISEYNKTAPPDKAIPTDIEVHPGRGGEEFKHGLVQAHMSGLKYFMLSKKQVITFLSHELKHIEIAEGIQHLIEEGVVSKQNIIADLCAIKENNLQTVLDSVNTACAQYIKALRTNPQLNEEDFVDALPGCDTRSTGIRDRFREIEEMRKQAADILDKLNPEADDRSELDRLLSERLPKQEIDSILKKLDRVAAIDEKFEVGGKLVKRIFEALKDVPSERIREFVTDYLAHRKILDYITEAREIAASDDRGFDVYIFVSTSQTEAEFWQERLEATRGQILPKRAIILSIFSEEDKYGHRIWHGETDKGSASLFAFTIANRVLATRISQEPELRMLVGRKYGKGFLEKLEMQPLAKRHPLAEILKLEKPIMMMLMAGRAKRMQPMAANNKSSITLPALVTLPDGRKVATNIGEAVAHSFGALAATRGGRLTEVWGDQVNLPGEDVSSDQRYAVEIFNTIYPFETPEDKKFAKSKGVLISAGYEADQDGKAYPDVVLREKLPTVEDIEENARSIDGHPVADLSLGFNSYRWEFLEALLEMYSSELKDRRGHFDIDSELWAPLTYETAADYAEYIWWGRYVAYREDLDKGEIDSSEFERLTSEDNEQAAYTTAQNRWGRIRNMRRRFTRKYPGAGYRIENNRKAGVIGRVDYGYRERTTDWWDFGQVRNYYDNLMLMLKVPTGIDSRRVRWSAERIRRYFGIRNKDDWIQNSYTGEADIDNSIVLNCNIGRGNIKNCILINVEAEEINAENVIIIGSKIYKLDLKEGNNIVQDIMISEEIKLKKGDVLVSHYIPGQGQKSFRVNYLVKDEDDPNFYDATEIYDKTIFGNPMTFRELSDTLKRYTKTEQNKAKEKSLKRFNQKIAQKRAKFLVEMIMSLVSKQDRNSLYAYVETLIKREALTPYLIKVVMHTFNEHQEKAPKSLDRTEMVAFCNYIKDHVEDTTIQQIAEDEKADLLKGKFGPTIDPDIYRRDAVRGEADLKLPNPVVEASGAAYVMALAQLRGKKPEEITIGLGRESRESGHRIMNAFIEGCLATGADVIDATNKGKKLTSTPAMYFATRYLENDKGEPIDGIVEVTAGHLSRKYNGLKPTVSVNNFTTEEMQIWLENTHDIIDKGIPTTAKEGNLREESILEPYWILFGAALRAAVEGYPEWLEYVEDKVRQGQISLRQAIDEIRPEIKDWLDTKPLEGLKLAADSGFGSMGPIIGPFLTNAGATLVDIGGWADYSKATKDANPNNPDNLTIEGGLCDKVAEISALLGMAFDVDGDMLGTVSHKGKILRGDDISCIIAPVVIREAIKKAEKQGKKEYKPIIILNILCSDRLKNVIREAGGIPVESEVSFNKVKEAMANPYDLYLEQYPEKSKSPEITPDQTAEMGVEISSQIMFKENFNSDNAFFAVIKLLGIIMKEINALGQAGQEVPDSIFDILLDKLPADYHTGEWRTEMISNEARIEVADKIKAHYTKMANEFPDKYRIKNTLDGIKVDFLRENKPVGFLVVRPSGTSPQVVIAVNSLVSEEIFNWIKNDYFAQMKEHEKSIEWEKLEPKLYYEQASAFVFEGRKLPEKVESDARRQITPGTRSIRTGKVDDGITAKLGTQEIVKAIEIDEIEETVTNLVTLDDLQHISNELIKHYGGLSKAESDMLEQTRSNIEGFCKAVVRKAVHIEDIDVARGLQIMSAQLLNITSWIDRGIPGAESMRVTTNVKNMVISIDKERGPSYIDKTTLLVKSTGEEGTPGFYYRGAERVDTKFTHDQLKNDTFADNRREAERTVMYVMDHGVIEVPEALREMTEEGQISTPHETTFINMGIQKSIRYTGTGKGHWQDKYLDMKQVTKGRILQLIDIYDDTGNKIETLANVVNEGETTRAIPGSVDYMIPLTDIVMFNDIRVEIPDEKIGIFNPHIKGVLELELIEKIVSETEQSNYKVIDFKGKPVLARVDATSPDITWITYPELTELKDLISFYKTASPEKIKDIVNDLAAARPTYLTETEAPMDVMDLEEGRQLPEYLRALRQLNIIIKEGKPIKETLTGILSGKGRFEDQHTISLTERGTTIERVKLKTGEFTLEHYAAKTHAALTLEIGDTVKVTTEEGEKLAELEKRKPVLVPLRGKIIFKSTDGAVVKVMYPETPEEKAVFTAIEAVSSYLEKGVIQRRLKDAEKKGIQILLKRDLGQVLYRGGAPHAEGRPNYEEEALESFLSKYLNTDVKITTVKDWSNRSLEGKVNPEYLQVSWTTDSELRGLLDGHLMEEMKNLAQFARIPPISSAIVEKLKADYAGQGWFYVRELEALSLLFACTIPEDITGKEDYTYKLLNAVNSMTTSSLSDVSELGIFLPLSEDILANETLLEAKYRNIINIILDKLPAQPFDARDEFHKRREALWSV